MKKILLISCLCLCSCSEQFAGIELERLELNKTDCSEEALQARVLTQQTIAETAINDLGRCEEFANYCVESSLKLFDFLQKCVDGADIQIVPNDEGGYFIGELDETATNNN